MEKASHPSRPAPSDVKISILIVNYNAGAHLTRCLDALRAQDFLHFEAIVIDNASADDSLARAVACFQDPRFRLIRNTRNEGFAAGNNIGAASARGAWIATLNPDAFANSDWLSRLIAATRRYPDADMFGSTQLDDQQPAILDGAGDAYLAIGIPWRGGKGQAADTVNGDYEVFGPCAAAALYRADAFRQVGGFDERLFCYVEDVDMAFRLRLGGSRCIQLRDAVVRHIGGVTSDQRRSFARFHGTRNITWVFLKNMPLAFLLPLLPLHGAALLYLLAKSTLRGNPGPVARGIAASLQGLGPAWRDRKTVQMRRRVGLAGVARFLCWSLPTYVRRAPHPLRTR